MRNKLAAVGADQSRFADIRVPPHSNCSRPSATMVAPHHIPLLLILSTFFASGLASDSFNDFSDNIDNAEEDGIEPSRFQKFIAKFEQEQQMNLEEEEMVGESSPKVTRQVSDEPLQQVFYYTHYSVMLWHYTLS